MKKMDIKVKFLDNKKCKIIANYGIIQEMSDYFSFYVDGYRFMPAYKNRTWDGKIYLLNKRTSAMNSGLIKRIEKFAEENNYTIEIDEKIKSVNPITKYEIKDFCKSLNLPFKVRSYQLDAIFHSLYNKKRLILSPTGSGKSCIIYCICRWLIENKNAKILIVVPTVSLVSQMKNDFEEYGYKDEIHEITSGSDKFTNKKITVSTWQSIYKLDYNFFKEFDGILYDECHLVKGKSLQTISDKCDAEYRFGFTGSLDKSQCNQLLIEGVTGEVFKTTTTKSLMDSGQLSEIKIKCCFLKYKDEERKLLKRQKYHDEISWLLEHERRNNFIVKLALKQKNNTMIFVNMIEHGENLIELLKEKTDRNVYLMNGSVKKEERENIRKSINNENNSILVCSYQTASTGINIPNIHSIIFAHPSKSLIRIVQSIGRGLRKHDSKEHLTLFDIVDDLQYGNWKNFGLQHYVERIKIYAKEKFFYKVFNIDI